ncbi:MAG: hypothetical protein EOO16_08625 [Chitinophagaceae bacterium]|nr:MAG: hypothetical protein EOO16_08625 [Chitinophagaceae bacterium]
MPLADALIIILFWILILSILWSLKEIVFRSFERQYTTFLYVALISGWGMLAWTGQSIGIKEEFIKNLYPELTGMLITVLVVDRITNFITVRNEQLYRSIAFRTCNRPLRAYCIFWFYIFQPNSRLWPAEIGCFEDLESFFRSDTFYRRVARFNFNGLASPGKSFARYYDDRFTDIAERFQNVLAKYASKLAHEDLRLLEHLADRAFLPQIFSIMRPLCEMSFTITGATGVAATRPFINQFSSVNPENFRKHFEKVIQLVEQYNLALEPGDEALTLATLLRSNTIATANLDPAIEW